MLSCRQLKQAVADVMSDRRLVHRTILQFHSTLITCIYLPHTRPVSGNSMSLTLVSHSFLLGIALHVIIRKWWYIKMLYMHCKAASFVITKPSDWLV